MNDSESERIDIYDIYLHWQTTVHRHLCEEFYLVYENVPLSCG